MRFIKILIAIIGVFAMPELCKAQYEELYIVDDNIFVTTKPNAVLYELSRPIYEDLLVKPISARNKRECIDLQYYIKKTLSGPQELKVLRYTNTKQQQGFNAYIVQYKKKMWILECQDVEDNTPIDNRNNQLLNHFSELNAKKQISYEQYDSLVVAYKKQCDDSITYYRNKYKNLEYEKDAAVKAAESNNEAAYDEALDKWYNSFPSSTKKLAESILIIEADLSSPNSVAGCDYWFRYINRSEKTIKYLDWTGVAYNAVDDPVSCDIRLRKTIEGRSTGPIAPNELGGGKWECVIYNYSARTIRLSKIKITYMDGSSKDLTVSNEDVKRMLERPIKEKVNKNSIIKKYDLKFANYNGKVKFWESRRVYLKQTILYISNNMPIDTKNRHYSYYAKNIADLKLKTAERDQYRKEFEKFERFLKFEKMQ